MHFIEEIIEKAKHNKKIIVLPETTDLRILEAASAIQKEGIADIILIGDPKEIKELGEKNKINLDHIKIRNPMNDAKFAEYVQKLMEFNSAKQNEKEMYEELLMDPVYFGMMMVKEVEADGLVSGACHTTKETLKPIMKIFKKTKHAKMMSTFLVMDMPDKINEHDSTMIFADCAFHERPGYLALSEIAMESYKSYQKLLKGNPKVAILSSIIDKENSETNQRIEKAIQRIQKKMPEIIVKREEALERFEYLDANILVFPNINTGNICCKMVERFAGAKLYGPICQGIACSINDLSRGCSVHDIIGTVAITAVQASEKHGEKE